MNKKNLTWNLVVVVIIIATICIVFTRIQINNLNSTIAYRDTTIVELEKKLSSETSDSNKVTELEAKVSTLEDEKTQLAEKLSTIENEKSQLEEKLSTIEDEKSQLEETSSSNSNSQNYLKIKFWADGKNYKITNEDMYFYKDSYLSKKVKNVIVVSPTISEDYLENGQTVYTVMSNKGLIFMSAFPNLEEIEGSHLVAPESAFSKEENEKYIALKFWKSTQMRKLSENCNQFWYSDCFLTDKLHNSDYLYVISDNVDNFKMSSNINIYSALIENGDIVWMHDSPSLETINE